MIRRATYDDVPVLMDVFRKARGIMRSSGNMNQWNDGYPSEAVVRKDIDNGHCYVLCEDGKVVATMAFIPGPDPTYAVIYDPDLLLRSGELRGLGLHGRLPPGRQLRCWRSG